LVENRKINESYKPSKPPAAGASFDKEKREWFITQRPTPSPEAPKTTTQNPLTDDDLRTVREQIRMMNDQAAHGPYSKDAGEYFDNIFLVQVHSRTDFTKFFLETIAKQPNLSKSKNLIVISHDIWREDMNFLTQNLADSGLDIPFVNIFFPKSVLFYKNEFPAASSDDCPTKIGFEGAEEANCQNREWFDTFDNYREPHIVNIKHHWWWKLNFVDQNFKFGYLILVEEDHALSEDALHVLDLMKDVRVDKGADLIALGHYVNNLKLATKLSKTPPDQVKVEEWFSGAYNMAMAVSKRWVDDVIAMKNDFCSYDDYNWDWTLFHLSKEVQTKSGKQPWKVMVPTLPRSQHMGITGCGVHFTRGGCDFGSIKAMFEKDQGILQQSGKMFPQMLTVAPISKKKSSPITRNGGWGDLRDILMCLEYSKNALDIDMSFLEKIKS